MECPRCHATIDLGTRYCAHCGLNVEELVERERERAEHEREMAEQAEREHEAAERSQREEEQALRAADADDTLTLARDDIESMDKPDAGSEVESLDEPVTSSGTELVSSTVEDEAPGASQSTSVDEGSALDREGIDRESAPEEVRRVAGSRRARVVAAVVAVALAVGAGSCVAHNREAARIEAEREATYQQALATPVDVAIAIEATGLDAAHATPVPLRVTGTTEAGDEVDELRLTSLDDEALELLPGRYAVSAGGDVVSVEGVLFKASVDEYKVDVSAEGDVAINESETDEEPSPLLFVYGAVEPADVRDADVKAAQAWMEEAGVEKATSYIDALKARNKDALDKLGADQAAREEENLRATEEAARKAQEQLKADSKTSNDYYSFDLPAEWQGKVEVRTTSGKTPGTLIFLPGKSDAWLARVSVEPGASVTDWGGQEQQVVIAKPTSDGTHHVEVRVRNWPGIAALGTASWYANLSDDELAQVVLLSTGGNVSYDYAVSSGDDYVFEAAADYVGTALSSLVVR